METNYELKHKHRLLPLKAMLLVVAMVFLGFSAFAQQGKSVKVATDEQLFEAMENTAITTIELAPGYYAILDITATSGTTVVKNTPNGNRTSSGCTYTISATPACYDPYDVHTPPVGPPMVGWSQGLADAGVINFTCLSFPLPCCPGDSTGRWSCTLKPAGAADPIFYDTTGYDMPFWVNKPGVYRFRYIWDPAVNDTLIEYAEVETEYYFFGPATLELEAPDVCGTTTYLDFTYVPGYPANNPGTIQWYVDYYPYGDPVMVDGPTATVEGEPFTVDCCGKAIITVMHSVNKTANEVCVTTASDTVEFSCEPFADAGDDAYVCYNDCFLLVGDTGLGQYTCSGYTFSSNYAFSFNQISGPATLQGLPAVSNQGTMLRSLVCLPEEELDPCAYGVYNIEFSVINGLCDSQDDMYLTFYEMPTADAGDDLSICAEDCFTLTAVPYEYCGEEGVNYFPHRWWTLVQVPEGFEGCTLDFDPLNPNPNVCITGDCECAYGEFIFQWNEANVKVTETGDTLWSEMQCVAFDQVSVTIYEQPDAFAGDDYWTCVDAANTPYTYYMEATMDYCYTMDGVWSKSCGPGDVVFDDINDPMSMVAFQQPGRYEFIWTLSNTECEDSDTVLFDLLEEPTAMVENNALEAECDELCIDLANANVNKHIYFGTDEGDCPNFWDMSHWGYVDGPHAGFNDPATVTFSPDATFADADMCVSYYGGYTIYWAEVNKPDDKDYFCADTVEVFVEFFETPQPYAGDDTTICDNCYTLMGELHEYLPYPNQHEEDYFEWRLVSDFTCGFYPYVSTFTVNTPALGELLHGNASFGPQTFNVTGDLELVNDGSINPTQGCNPLIGFTPGKIALIDRGSCFFSLKALNAQNAGAIGVVIVNNIPGGIVGNMSAGDDSEITIPVMMISYEDGQALKAAVANGVNVTMEKEAIVTIADPHALNTQVCFNPEFDDACGTYYGTYCFELYESNGDKCDGFDRVAITFGKEPDPLPLSYTNESNCWDPMGDNRAFDPYGCMDPGDVIYVCADGCTDFSIMDCGGWFDPNEQCFWGWTFEWSVTGPAGMSYETQPGYFDFTTNQWVLPYLSICWGECCDTARVYLTITTPDCESTYEYKVFVHHKPCIDLVGPDVSEVGLVTTYCSECPEYDNDCLLYTWTAEHCGEIISGQGTECIEVLWTDYNVNGGWGRITLTVLDTCTGCCNYEEMMVKIWPTGTLGDGALSGYVYYHNNIMTPLNGVDIQLWNGEIPVMATTSFNDIEGGNGMGYFTIEGISETTNFGVTAAYGAPWYGANATDALAVELKTIDALPVTFVFDDVVEEAMDANNSGSITATDALWIKQRAISMVNYFPAGDWVFAPDMETMATDAFTIWALNAGDANRSNIPASMKETPAIAMVKDGVMNVNAEEVFEFPIRVAEANVFGAVTLNLGYDPATIEVVDVLPMNGMVTNIGDGNVSIAWSSVNPMILAENDVVAILKVKAIGEVAASNDLFRVEIGSEFADATARVIEPVILKTYGITTSPAAEDFFLSANRPNPFNTSTFIEYTLPETGKVRLSVLDMLGQEIAVVVESTQTAGSYSVEFSAAGLATGVYVYKITVDGETRDYISTQRMVISH